MNSIRTSRLELISWSLAWLRTALEDQTLLPELVPYQLPAQFPGDLSGLLRLRLAQLERDSLERAFLLRSIVLNGQMIVSYQTQLCGQARGWLRGFPRF